MHSIAGWTRADSGTHGYPMSMHIQSAFKINAAPAEAWVLLTDIARVGPCFPGAEIGEAQAEGMYRANFKVRLGPVSLSFAGKVGFAELDQAQGLAVRPRRGDDRRSHSAAGESLRRKSRGAHRF
jgi:carbon monoxide dehydrogenase subunit G